MKKNNKTLRVAAVLAVGALLSTCLVSGTFAKYTMSGTSTDNARVAKFGVKVVPTSDSMFKTSYETIDKSGYTGNSVVSSNTDKMVAPGTAGGLTAMKLEGTPEVAVRVTNKAEVTLTGWTIDTNAYYCPLQVKIGEETLKGTDYTSADLFKQAIEQKIDAYTKDYAPGVDLSTKQEAAPVVSWTWAIDGDGVKQTDAKDTKLGDAGTAKIDIKVTTTVTQID